METSRKVKKKMPSPGNVSVELLATMILMVAAVSATFSAFPDRNREERERRALAAERAAERLDYGRRIADANRERAERERAMAAGNPAAPKKPDVRRALPVP